MVDFDPATLRELEQHVTEVASGASSRFVLVLADDLEAVKQHLYVPMAA